MSLEPLLFKAYFYFIFIFIFFKKNTALLRGWLSLPLCGGMMAGVVAAVVQVVDGKQK